MLNWTRRLIADGVVFYPPEGRLAGAVRVRERVRPLLSLRALRDEHLRRLPEGMIAPRVEAGPTKRLLNAEGEHGASYEIAIESDGMRALTCVGLLFGDDFYASIEAFTAVPDLFDAFRHAVQHLTTTLPLGLGALRRRRYEYLPPDGWQALVKTHSVSWYPADFPKNRSVIRVYDAKPANTSPAVLVEKRLFEDPQNDLHAVTDSTIYELLAESGLRGAYEVTRGVSMDGAPALVIRATLSDKRFAYNLRLEACEPDVDESRRRFDEAVKSVLPVPQPPSDEAGASLIQWAE